MEKPCVKIIGITDPIHLIGLTIKSLIEHGHYERANEFKNRAIGRSYTYIVRLINEYAKVIQYKVATFETKMFHRSHKDKFNVWLILFYEILYNYIIK